MNISVLIAEDEPRVRDFVKKGLEQRGLSVTAVDNLEAIESTLKDYAIDILILDRLLGRSDSLNYLPHLKQRFPHLKILILSALAEANQRVAGLNLGADDYLGKPFHLEELVARIRNLVRRESTPATSQTLSFHDLTLHLDTHKAKRGDHSVELTLKELRLLSVLVSAPERIFTRSELLDRAWDMNFDPGSNLVDVTIGRLKKKLNLAGLTPLIHPVRGVGYALQATE